MDIGMLWFDNDKKASFEKKVERARDYYLKKYGKKPNLCFVHPVTCGLSNRDALERYKQSKSKAVLNGVEIRVTTSLLPHHYWIGVNSC